MKKVLVTITSSNQKQKIHQDEFECETMIDVTRIMLTYRKKGYEIVNIMVDFVEVLI